MENAKLERVKNICDEVNDFHPLLKVLLSKLPNVTHVEYKQGPNEMGADFILTKHDSTLDDIEYIGCIVKTGQIKQDHSEINRQIEECEIERTIEGGIKKIYISEIWVITSGSITHNAQSKIHHTYKNKNIKFLSGEKVTELIERYYPEYWTDINVNIGVYLRSIRDTCEVIGNSNNLIDATKLDIYVPQDLLRKTTKKSFESHKKPAKKTTIDEIIKNNKYILIEAMMGTGKSTLLSRLAKSYTDSQFFNLERMLPIIVTAKEVIEIHKSNIENLIKSTLETYKIEGQNGYLILIDALDEIKVTSDDRFNLLQNIRDSSQTYENIKVIITTRNIDDPEREAEIDKIFVRYDLCLLTIKQVLTLVDKFCKNNEVRARLSRDLDKSHIFRVLPKTPISAILLAKLLNENIQEVPSTMTELYIKYMELVLGRWDMDKGLQSQREYDIINNVTTNIAKFIMDNSLIEISTGDAKTIFNDYVDSRNLNIDKETVYVKLINKSEIYKYNKVKNTISFKHRTFAEFFYASGLDRDNSAHISEEIYDLYWATSYFFYIGMKRDCPEILSAIDNIVFTSDRHRLLKTFNNGYFLLAAYLTPYDVIKKSVVKSFYDVSYLYCNSLQTNTETPLSSLSPIQLLSLFTHCLCDTFGYDFFKEALEERALDLGTTPVLQERDYTELFLLNSVLLSINKLNAFDKMVESYGNSIPLQLQAGILEHTSEYETKKNSESIIIKKFIKKFYKNLKGNQSYSKTLIALYETPISKLNTTLITKMEKSN